MALNVLFALLALCTGQTISPTTSPSQLPSCFASPGYFCSNGFVLICPIGAYCTGGVALNVSCYPVTACTVTGLSAQPLCYWNASTLTGTGVSGFADGARSTAMFSTNTNGLAEYRGTFYLADVGNNCVRVIYPNGTVASLLRGTGYTPRNVFVSRGHLLISCQTQLLNYSLSSNTFSVVTSGLNVALCAATNPGGSLYIVESLSNRIVIVIGGSKSTFAGSGSAAFADGVGISASFYNPNTFVFVGPLMYVADTYNHRIRLIQPNASVSTIAGSGSAAWLDGLGTSSSFYYPAAIASDFTGTLYVADNANTRIRIIRSMIVSTLAGSSAGYVNGFSAAFRAPWGLAVDASGVLTIGDISNFAVRQLTCVPCPTSYFCFSGAPVLCPAGSYCPFSSINATLCPYGTFSKAGASYCTLCPAGTFSSASGSTSCQQCPGGHYCPAGTTSWATLNCGRGNHCPLGSGAPTPCPFQVPPSGGWGALQVQGPAFLVETARCLNHCFWNFTSGKGMLSIC